MVILTSRQAHLLKLLNSEEDYQTTDYYANQMGISGRTVHSEIRIIDDYLKNKYNIKIRRKRGVGIRLDGEQKEKLVLMTSISGENCASNNSTIERRETIIAYLLKNENATNFRKLSDHFFVSISSITNDMQEVERWLSRFQIDLIKGKHGTSIKGNELSIRKAIAGLIEGKIDRLTDSAELNKNVDKEKYEQILSTITYFLSKDRVNQAEKMINFIEKELNCRFNDSYYIHMMIWIAVMLERQAVGHLLEQIFDEDHLIRNLHILKTYVVAKEALEKYGNKTNQNISEGEVQYLNHCIMGTGIDEDIGSGNVREYNSDVQRLALKLCWLASDTLKINLDHDPILYKGLLVHLEPMLNRMKYGIVIKNPLLEQIKEQYSPMFGLTSFLGTFIENETHLKINENEIGFLMVHFQAALERNSTSTKIMVVCPGGIGTSELVANRIKRLMPSLEIVGVCSLRNINNADLKNIDFIISTVPLKKNIQKPVVIVSPMMGMTDAKIINNFYLEYIFKNKKEFTHFHHLSTVVKEELIFANLSLENKDDIIDFISLKMKKNGYVSSQFADSVKDREKVATTDLGNNVAIPHGQGKYVNQSVVAVATLSTPIYWGKNKVSLVILIAMRIDEKKETKAIMADLYKLFDSKPVLDELMKASSKTEVMNILGKN